MALYVDGTLAQEKTAPGGLTLNPKGNTIDFNHPSGRSPVNTVFYAARVSNVERVPGQQAPPPSVDVRTLGLEVPAGR